MTLYLALFLQWRSLSISPVLSRITSPTCSTGPFADFDRVQPRSITEPQSVWFLICSLATGAPWSALWRAQSPPVLLLHWCFWCPKAKTIRLQGWNDTTDASNQKYSNSLLKCILQSSFFARDQPALRHHLHFLRSCYLNNWRWQRLLGIAITLLLQLIALGRLVQLRLPQLVHHNWQLPSDSHRHRCHDCHSSSGILTGTSWHWRWCTTLASHHPSRPQRAPRPMSNLSFTTGFCKHTCYIHTGCPEIKRHYTVPSFK